ncbi:MAG: ABC transporter ATP-binding protein [Candidatus Eisenbacteria bacterium]
MTGLRLEGVEKVFPGGTTAVAGVDLEVKHRELVVLLGPSGCGKSTLLRMIAGIESPTRGRIWVGEEDVTDLPPQRRDIAMVFQNYALYPHMNVRENLGFGLRMRGQAREHVTARVGEVAESLGLTTLLDRRPAQLSGGQRQRVALGRAIARHAKVFLLDEPLSNLDAQLRVNTRLELARLHQRVDAPMVYVTHDQEEAMTLGDRVVVMRAGQVLQVGTPMEIYQRPATAFVGGFVGSPRMNFVPGRLEQGSISLLGVRVSSTRAVDRVREVTCGIRPEDLGCEAASGDGIAATVEVIEPLGRDQLVHVAVGEGSASTSLRALLPSTRTLDVGQRVTLRIEPARLHLFDPAGELRID